MRDEADLERENKQLKQKVKELTQAYNNIKTKYDQLAKDKADLQTNLQAILDNLPAHVYWFNPQGYMQGCNQVQAESLGKQSPKDLEGQHPYDLVDPEEASTIMRSLKQVLREQKPLSFEEITTYRQKRRTFLSKKIPLKEGNQITSILGVSIDITDKKEKEAQQRALETERLKAYSKIAAQVAHDIRSPLTALDSAISYAKDLSEEQRIVIRNAAQRINDIANNLLKQYQKPEQARIHSGALENCLLYPTLDQLISEKRQLIKDQHNKQLDLTVIDNKDYMACAVVNNIELSRVISNLINNAIEAISESGSINVFLQQQNKYNQIIIQDSGQGIEPNQLEYIFEQGATYNKPNGTGMGLYHAKYTLENWGGRINITSELEVGTQVKVELPIADHPQWLERQLLFMEDSSIIIVDDDDSIHDIWEQRLDKAKNIIHFTCAEQFCQWWEAHSQPNYFFLFDHELLNSDYSGLDLIEHYQLGPKATLVTSHYEHDHIIQRCLENKVRLLPKKLSNHIAIHYLPHNPDCVLIDDAAVIHDIWLFQAKLAQKNLLCFESPLEFERLMDWIPYSTPLFIDSSLGHGIQGQEIAKHYYDLGYEIIYLATGHSKKEFGQLPWITGIVNKSIPSIIRETL